MKKETKEVVAVEQTTALTQAEMNEWGDSNEMSSSDLVIPKILAMQGLSKLVTDGAAKFGEFCNSLTGEVVGGINKPIKIVPFYMQKIWIISKGTDKTNLKFTGIEQVTPENEFQPWEEIIDGEIVARKFVRNFYCLIPELGDMCFIIAFQGKSARAGKILATQMYTINKLAGKSPAGKIVEVSGIKEQNDKGVFVVLKTRPLEDTSVALQQDALKWLRLVKQGAVKVDNSDLSSEHVESSTTADDSEEVPF